MKKIFVVLILHLFVLQIAAQTTFTVGGIKYKTTSSNTVEVTSGGTYSGDIVIPSTVMYLGVTYNVNKIGDEAFTACTGLTSITIQPDVTTIGDRVFWGCTGLASLNIPSSVTIIGYEAFAYCYSLTSIVIPKSVTSIGVCAFSYCTNLMQFIVDIDNPNFSSLEGVLFNKGRDSLIAYPNRNSSQYVIPSSVTSIGDYAFCQCYHLTSITIPSTVTSIGDYAFWECGDLLSIDIPSSVTSIGDYAFSGCTALKQFIVDIDNPYFSSLEGVLFNKDKDRLIACFISKIQYDIPFSVTTIGKNAFDGYSGLMSITIPSSVTTIEDYAFSGCTGLASLNIPSSITTIGDYAFSGCQGIKSIDIPSSVTSIGDNAFRLCSGLTSITIPSSVNQIGENAFRFCENLNQFTVEIDNPFYSSQEGVLFNKDKDLLIACLIKKTMYDIPSSVTTIGNYAFSDFYRLSSITIPSSVTSIGDYAFSDCGGLKTITIPSSTIIIGDHAFEWCYGLNSITIPSSVKTIGDYAFDFCTGLTSIDIPSSVTSIGSYTFSKTCLASIAIPSSVTSIGEGAFSNCGVLTAIIIPSSVKTIGEYAFRDCSGLSEIHCQMEVPLSITSNTFYNVNKSSCKLYVPMDSYRSYRSAPGWSDFAIIIEEEVTAVKDIETNDISVYTEQDAIVVEGDEHREAIFVYTISGVLVKVVNLTSDNIRIPVPSNQIYLVKVGSNTYKVVL